MDSYARGYALRYAALYSAIIMAILSLPLYVYYTLLASIDEAKTSVELKEQGLKIVQRMEEFSPENSPFFQYPRFASYQSGLYDAHFKAIFTVLETPVAETTPGYHALPGYRYCVRELPEGRYFGASFLVVGKPYDRSEIFQKVALIFSSIVVIVYGLSFFVLHTFSTPFKRLNKMQDDFIKDAMHEIKTPLSIININADLLQRKFGADRRLRHIKAASKTLAGLYDDMEYLIRKDKREYPKESMDFSDFLRARVDYFREVGEMKNIVIKEWIEEDIYLYFNPVEMQRIVDNNLSNAVKYSHENGRIDVHLYLKNDTVYFRVKDRGVGIKDVHQIFRRYYRENETKGGLGIGLAIVKNIIDREGIELKVKSTPGKGSTFGYAFSLG